MFQSSPFNQPVRWDTSNLLDTSRMFRSNQRFNQALDTWNVWRVTNMQEMFYAVHITVSLFNQPLNHHGWNT